MAAKLTWILLEVMASSLAAEITAVRFDSVWSLVAFSSGGILDPVSGLDILHHVLLLLRFLHCAPGISCCSY